ncbi:MAG: outer membrane protein assembly factor BamE [Gammaproteobacteria bacterium]|nr:outer membrane protein assembly factor BamE [Gammaproteobacteria bacterium]MDH5778439.1 outer membrane protein assembly factor BamE [Gammaproteobacteria bacterium]
MRKILIQTGVFILLGLSASACSVHQIDIQQGNVIEKEQLDKLKTGMTRKQVNFLLGTPMLQDPFHKNRWDYVYSYKVGNEDTLELRKLTLHFKKDVLKKIVNKGYPNPKKPLDTAN